MNVVLSPFAGVGAQFFTDAGVPLAGGLVYSFLAGTTTPAATYTTSSGATANSNPIVLDAGGRIPYQVWLPVGVGYKFIVSNSNDVQLLTFDNVYTAPAAVLVADLAPASSIGARSFVSDATATTFASVVAGGGSNKVPVYSDGVSWRIG
jgi:hypothetical protein